MLIVSTVQMGPYLVGGIEEEEDFEGEESWSLGQNGGKADLEALGGTPPRTTTVLQSWS